MDLLGSGTLFNIQNRRYLWERPFFRDNFLATIGSPIIWWLHNHFLAEIICFSFLAKTSFFSFFTKTSFFSFFSKTSYFSFFVKTSFLSFFAKTHFISAKYVMLKRPKILTNFRYHYVELSRSHHLSAPFNSHQSYLICCRLRQIRPVPRNGVQSRFTSGVAALPVVMIPVFPPQTAFVNSYVDGQL